jgi:hypothetical protein
MEAKSDAEDKWSKQCQEIVEATLIPRTESWWTGSNVEGKPQPKLFPVYNGGVQRFAEICDEVVEKGYEGFVKASETTIS